MSDECGPEYKGIKWNTPVPPEDIFCDLAASERPKRVTVVEDADPVQDKDNLDLDELLVWSDEVTVDCKAENRGPFGDSVTLPQGDIAERISLDQIPDLTDAQTKFIQLNFTDAIVDKIKLGTITLGELGAGWLLSEKQASYLVSLVTSTIQRITGVARKKAVGMLACFWKSDQITINCEDGTLSSTVNVAYPGLEPTTATVVRKGQDVFLPAGAQSSSISQVDADLKARRVAEAAYSCFYCNGEFIAACEVALSAEIVSQNIHGQTVIEAEAVCATTRADTAALIVNLNPEPENCYYCIVVPDRGDPVCPDIEGRPILGPTAPPPFAPAPLSPSCDVRDPRTRRPGDGIILDPGAGDAWCYSSIEDATCFSEFDPSTFDPATDCFYGNLEHTCDCSEEDPPEVFDPPVPGSVTTVTIPEGTFFGRADELIDDKDPTKFKDGGPDKKAEELCLSMLICPVCNEEQEAFCDEGSVNWPLPLPDPEEIDPPPKVYFSRVVVNGEEILSLADCLPNQSSVKVPSPLLSDGISELVVTVEIYEGNPGPLVETLNFVIQIYSYTAVVGVVEEGTVCSLSQSAANAEAMALAEDLKICAWYNKKQIARWEACGAAAFLHEEGEVADFFLISLLSDYEANRLAHERAKSLAVCGDLDFEGADGSSSIGGGGSNVGGSGSGTGADGEPCPEKDETYLEPGLEDDKVETFDKWEKGVSKSEGIKVIQADNLLPSADGAVFNPYAGGRVFEGIKVEEVLVPPEPDPNDPPPPEPDPDDPPPEPEPEPEPVLKKVLTFMFRPIVPRDEDENEDTPEEERQNQLQVKEDCDVIRITGNGKEGELSISSLVDSLMLPCLGLSTDDYFNGDSETFSSWKDGMQVLDKSYEFHFANTVINNSLINLDPLDPDYEVGGGGFVFAGTTVEHEVDETDTTYNFLFKAISPRFNLINPTTNVQFGPIGELLENQIKVVDHCDHISIEGNGKEGKLVTSEYDPDYDPDEGVVLSWQDGLITTDGLIELGELGGGGPSMWKVTASEMDGAATYNVKGGILVVQGTKQEVADATVPAIGDGGYVWLKVVRHSASRAYVSHIIEFSTAPPTSTSYEEFTVLAEITAGVITQCRNDEICSHELMLVENGEFKLMPFQTNSRNSYDPPEPEPEP